MCPRARDANQAEEVHRLIRMSRFIRDQVATVSLFRQIVAPTLTHIDTTMGQQIARALTPLHVTTSSSTRSGFKSLEHEDSRNFRYHMLFPCIPNVHMLSAVVLVRSGISSMPHIKKATSFMCPKRYTTRRTHGTKRRHVACGKEDASHVRYEPHLNFARLKRRNHACSVQTINFPRRAHAQASKRSWRHEFACRNDSKA